MFFFEAMPWYNAIIWLVVLGILIGINEFIRASKWGSIAIFMVLPVILTPVWLNSGSEITSWFTWIKVYSAVAGSIIFMVIRFTNFHKKHKWYLTLVPIILGLNILEAVIREFQVGLEGFNGMVDGVNYISGGWNYVNASAGILSIILICGWFGIYRRTGKRKDMVWPDQTTMYVIAYAFWNISYVYSCAPGNAFYSGFALNIAPIIPALFWAKGTWIQNRAHTLSVWMIWVMTFPYFFAGTDSAFRVALSYNPTANWTLALLALTSNALLAIWQLYRIVKYRLNPLNDEIWTDTKGYEKSKHMAN
ncbi:hypothetical protein GOQ27_13110 [Clostridium sp. D2Q-11]|uniref:Uncharacterized protein n=1 Tax=Anaeromonas frigoriresistens TaxID=2683708 RepID=A0A942Z9Q6_9FIRM|nr:DUF5692 family protein [Anaeromonas frigoriresistens]MBS4539409.1 hypothetical protein [Anaeromonas frigoriresistens]